MSYDDESWTLRCLPTAEIARRVGLKQVTIGKWCRLGRVRRYKMGKLWWAHLDDCIELARQVRRRDPHTGVVID